MPSPLDDAVARTRAELLKTESETARRLAEQYARVYRQLYQEYLTIEEQARLLGADYRLYRREQLRSLMGQTKEQLDRYGVWADTEINSVAVSAIGQGANAALDLVVAGAPPELATALRASFGQFSPEAVETLFAYLQPDSPLRQELTKQLGAARAQAVGDGLFEAITKGWNPNRLAKVFREELGMALTQALRISRTAVLNAYRDAAIMRYAQNPRVVRGWRWSSALDNRACFLAGTQIVTASGNKPIETVRVGDLVMTHSGAYRRVTQITERPYCGNLVHLVASNRELVCTPEHPLLIKRQGHLDWVKAGGVLLGDSVICQIESGPDICDHRFGQSAIKSSVWDTNDAMPLTLKPKRFTGIAISDKFIPVPIDAVYFEDGIKIGQEKVNRITPSGEHVFLAKGDADSFQTQPDIAFRLGLTRVAPITADGTIDLMRGRNSSKFFSASRADMYLRGTAAFFRAIATIPQLGGVEKYLAATLASYIKKLFALALQRTEIIPMSIALWNRERFATTNTRFDNLKAAYSALFRTIKRWAAALTRGFELLATMGAGANHAWNTSLARFPMWMFSLKRDIASPRAELSASAPNMTWRRGEFGSAFLTDSIHSDIISQDACHVKTVYNLEVEQEHSYVANGFVVHNCLACIASHGSIHPATEKMRDHWSGRCVAIPVTVDWSELGVPGQPAQEPPMTGEAWFNAQSEATQREMMGNARYDAWKDGAFEFGDLRASAEDPVWGQMIIENSLKGLLGEAAKKYYKGA